ncbi:MAG: TetR family transcriptional regulator C-terminal domain-containing protein [Clostridia bacterium]|nr:TetR family transcriptional regulator C-terminal domain-containing protein [Clostridia bacterium]
MQNTLHAFFVFDEESALNLYPFPQTTNYTNCPSKELKLKLNYIAGGSLYAIQQWLSDPEPITPQQMTEHMLQYANTILSPNQPLR